MAIRRFVISRSRARTLNHCIRTMRCPSSAKACRADSRRISRTFVRWSADMAKPIIVITGASQGIGAAIARVFAKQLQGCQLALIARSEKNLARVARACAGLGAARAESFACDVTSSDAVAATAAAVL